MILLILNWKQSSHVGVVDLPVAYKDHTLTTLGVAAVVSVASRFLWDGVSDNENDITLGGVITTDTVSIYSI